jgi:hypothetical protein
MICTWLDQLMGHERPQEKRNVVSSSTLQQRLAKHYGMNDFNVIGLIWGAIKEGTLGAFVTRNPIKKDISTCTKTAPRDWVNGLGRLWKRIWNGNFWKDLLMMK